MTVLSLFINAGITHVMLLLLNGARRGFETTMRVAAYAHGSAAMLNLVPLCGGIIGSIWALVVVIIGIAAGARDPDREGGGSRPHPDRGLLRAVLVFYAAIAALVFGASWRARVTSDGAVGSDPSPVRSTMSGSGAPVGLACLALGGLWARQVGLVPIGASSKP